MAEADRMHNIVMSYMRDGLAKGEAVRAAADCVARLEARREALRIKRGQQPAPTQEATDLERR